MQVALKDFQLDLASAQGLTTQLLLSLIHI